MKRSIYLITFLVILALGLGGTLTYGYTLLKNLRGDHANQSDTLRTAQETIIARDAKIAELEQTIRDLEQKYALSEENGAELLSQLNEEKGRNDDFEKQIKGISTTVGKLDKLSKTDPELLQKYSKVFFLNEHYAPEKVAEIPTEFRFKTDEAEYMNKQVLPFLTDLLEDAKEDGVELLVVSGYRSFDEQRDLKNAYTVQYGSGANTFSADQGYSEHQLGTTVDFTTRALSGSLTGFDKTPEFEWLVKNAHRYGFVLSYPENNAYYIYEPWHWRFVGEDLADDLHDDGKFFYDLDQREIDKYLISIFD